MMRCRAAAIAAVVVTLDAVSAIIVFSQKIDHMSENPVRIIQVHVVVTADHADGDVGPLAVELVGVFQVRGVPAAVLIGQNEHDRARDVAQDLLLLVERHHRIERQFQALVAGERVLVAVVVRADQRSAGQYPRRLDGQLGRPAGHHFGHRLVERVRRRQAAALSTVQRLRGVDPAADRGQRVAHVHRPGPHGVQHDQAPDAFRVDARQPRAQLSAETVAQVRQLGPAEMIQHPFDGGQIVGELERQVRGEMVGTAVAGQVDAHVIVTVRQRRQQRDERVAIVLDTVDAKHAGMGVVAVRFCCK